MEVIKIPLSKLIPDPANARKHDEKNLNAIKGSLAKFGQQKPIVVNPENVIIAGNGTYEAAKSLDWPFLDCFVTTLTKPEQIAFALADNRTSDLSEFDPDILSDQLRALLENGLDISALGFDESEIIQPDNEGLTDPDALPEIPQNVHGVKLGDIWQLGEHRLMCGDSTSKENVEKLMNGEKADMVFTDPPYEYTASNSGGGCWGEAASKVGKKIEHLSSFDPTEFLNSLPLYLSNNFCAYIFSNAVLIRNYANWAFENKKSYNLLTWHKASIIPANNNHHFPDTEYCSYIASKAIWNLGLDADCYRKYWLDDREKNTVHPTMKPVSIIERCIRVNSNKSVADPFLGSGSTLIACEKTNRKCYGMELDPHYCSVIIERWQNFTGKKAQLISEPSPHVFPNGDIENG